MYKFSQRSENNLAGAHSDLGKLCAKVLDLGLFDFGITCGHRGKEEQDKAVFEGRSKIEWPNSKHNKLPAQAVDIILYINGKPDNYSSFNSWYMAIGVFRGVAAMLDINIRVGADWDGDFSTKDQSFHDIVHIELKG